MRGVVRSVVVGGVAAAALTAPQSASAAGLTKARYDALDAVYTDFARLKEDAPLSAITKVCSKLDDSDSVLGTQRRQCLALPKFLKAAALEACGEDTPSGVPAARPAQSRKAACQAAVAGARREATALARASQAAQRALQKDVSSVRCRNVLGPTAKDVRDVRALASAYRALERALRSGSERNAKRAARRIADSDFLDSDSENESRFAERKRFRQACAPES